MYVKLIHYDDIVLVIALFVKVFAAKSVIITSMKYAIAVIDIGMTNKKVAIYDENLSQQEAFYKNFAPLKATSSLTGEELDLHDLAGMEEWFIEQIAAAAKKYPIKAISITTHGATAVCVDKSGNVCAPCVFYTHEPGEAFQDEFYSLFGDKNELQKTTATPPLSAMINLAKGIFFLKKHFAPQFEQTATILNLPQYFGYRFTGVAGVEPTFMGCHTYLLDPYTQKWSAVAEKLGIADKLPANYRDSCEKLGNLSPAVAEKLGLSTDVIVTMGLHDSNASLLPYLAKNDAGDFILNSTGTWCVCMHPQEKISFTEDDIGKIVFYNQSAFRKPVKTSIFLGGMEVDTYVKLYKKINNTDDFPSSDENAVNEILAANDTFILPEVVAGSGQFPASKAGVWERGTFYPLADIQSLKAIPEIMRDKKRFFAVLDLSLAIQTETALRRAGLGEDTKVFTEGGFRKNALYNAIIASVLGGNEVFLTSMKEATAFGAAMSAAMVLEGKSHTALASAITIEYNKVSPFAIKGYEDYKNKFIALAK